MRPRETTARLSRRASLCPERQRFRRLSIIAVAATASLVYANALANGFALDDGGVLLSNPLVTSPSTAWRAFALPYWPESIGSGQYRPLAILTFAADWALSGGSAAWLHAVNVAWHAGVCIAVLLLAAELLAPATALVAALVFAVHPVHVEAVANVVGRLECMAALFVIAALLAHRRGSWAAPAFFAGGLLSKESAVGFLALAALHDALLAGAASAAYRARRWWYAAYGGILVAYAAVLALLFAGERTLSVPSRALADASVGQRLLTAGAVIPHYVRLLLAPFDLSADYEPGVIPLVTRPTLGVTIGLGLAALLAMAIARAWRRHPALAFALGWVPIALAPVANVFFTSGVVLAERTLYLPSVGACLAIGAGIEAFVRRTSLVTAGIARREGPGDRYRSPVRIEHITLIVVVALVAFAARTWTRTPAWRDDRAYLLTLLAEHPESYRAHLTAGRVQIARRDWAAAERELATARRIFARDPLVYREAATVALALGRAAQAEQLLDTAAALAPRDGEIRRRLSALRTMREDP